MLDWRKEIRMKQYSWSLTFTRLSIASHGASWIGSYIKWTSLDNDRIRSCVMSVFASILLNGSLTQPFKLQRVLRQGDSLSPFLFDLVVESLNLLILKATSLNLWNGIEICRNGQKIYHLQYVDDTILFFSPSIEALVDIKKMLILFDLSSRLQVNFHKSMIIWLECWICNNVGSCGGTWCK